MGDRQAHPYQLLLMAERSIGTEFSGGGPSAEGFSSTCAACGVLGSPVRAGEGWRFFTYQWLHAGYVSCLLNLSAVDALGLLSEQLMGCKMTLGLYLFSGGVAGGWMFCVPDGQPSPPVVPGEGVR